MQPVEIVQITFILVWGFALLVPAFRHHHINRK